MNECKCVCALCALARARVCPKPAGFHTFFRSYEFYIMFDLRAELFDLRKKNPAILEILRAFKMLV